MADEELIDIVASTTISTTWADLDASLKNIKSNGTYYIKITDPEKIVINNVDATTNSIGKIFVNNAIIGIYYDLTATDLTKAKATSFSSAFKGCSNILKIGALPITYLKNAEDMFSECSRLYDVDVDALAYVEDASRMFRNCFGLKNISLGRMINIIEADEMFFNCVSLEKADVTMLGKIDTSERMFSGCKSLVELIVSSEFLEDLKISTNMLAGCTSLKKVKSDNPAYIDRSTIVRGDLDVDNYLTVSDASKKSGATIHGDLIVDNVISHNSVSTNKLYSEGLNLNNAKSDIFYNKSLKFGDREFLFKQDPLEFIADDNVKWVAQSKIGHVSNSKKILLLFQYNETYISAISGQLRVSSPNTTSNFIISLSSDGKYTFFSNSGKKNLSAEIVYCIYNNKSFYGLYFNNFNEDDEYKVYYSGFFTAENSFINYESYTDKDIYIGNSYCYGTSNNLTVNSLQVEPVVGSPSMTVCKSFGTINSSRSVILLCKKTELAFGTIGGQIYEYGDGITAMYHFSISSNGARFLLGSSSFETNATFVECEYENNIYYGLQFPLKTQAQLLFQGFDRRDILIMPPQNYIDTDLKATKIPAIFDTIGSSTRVTKTVSLDGETLWNFDSVPASFFNNSNNAGVSFGNNLTLTSTIPTSIYPNIEVNGNKGYIEISKSSTIFNLLLDSSCTIQIKFFASVPNQYLYIMNNGQMDSLVPTVANNGECILEYNDTNKSKHEISICSMNASAPICISSILLKTEVVLATEINRLPFTEDGVPHNIKITGNFTKERLQTLAFCLTVPERLINLDLSMAVLDNSIVNWDAYTGLNTVFNNCFSIATIKLPSNLHKMEGQIFYNCNALKEIVLNDKLYSIYGNSNTGGNGIFTNTSIRDILIPYNVEIIGKNAFAKSDIESVVFSNLNKALINNKSIFESGALLDTLDKLQLKVTKEFYRLASYTNWWFSVNPGKVPNDIYSLYDSYDTSIKI